MLYISAEQPWLEETAMKQLPFTLACMLGILLCVSSASGALAITGDSTYIGFVDPDTPANATAQASYINTLIDQAAGATNVQIDTRYYNRQNSTLDTSSLPDAVVGTSENCNVPTCIGTGIDVQGWTYLLGKYGNTGFVWYVGGLSTVDLPSTISSSITTPKKNGKGTQNIGGGLSHFTLYNYSAVPDGGTTLILLGGALVGIETLRRRLSQ